MKNYIGFKARPMFFDAHLTVLYTGNLDSGREATTQSLITQFIGHPELVVYPHKISMFGPKNNIPVIEVQPSDELIQIRKLLLDFGLPSPSEFKWNPHITLPRYLDRDIYIPSVIHLVGFGIY